MPIRAVQLGGLALGLLVAGGLLPQPVRAALDSAVHLAELLPPEIQTCSFAPARPDRAERKSIYVPMADGVRLAVDIILPEGAGSAARLPTLYSATRYWRSERGGELSVSQLRWIASGFAVVNVDVRGTGASFGQWYVPYSPQETRDIGELARWIAKQPWSNGKIVMTGVSYPGTTPMLALAYGSPVIKAIAPRFADFDMYTDLLWPGGVVAEDLIVGWGREVRKMDLNGGGEFARANEASVRPVDGVDGEALLQSAVKEHQLNPWSFASAAGEITFDDEASSAARGLTIRDGGVYTHREAIERSGAPIFGWGSWLDSGIAQGLLNRFVNFSNPQLTVIGPWTHGARATADPFNLDAPLEPSDEVQQRIVYCYLKRFALDEHAPAAAERSIVYFTMGEDRWKKTRVWPLPGTRQMRFFLDAHQMLRAKRPGTMGRDEYKVDFDASAGPDNRWATQKGQPRIDYGDRAGADKRLLTYTSGVLPQDIEVTGQPVITLEVVSTHTDGNFIAYLEDVAPGGRVTYLTEGELRAIHRKLSSEPAPYRTTYPYRTFARKDALPLVPGQVAELTFQLQATSALFKAGHRVRVAIAGADKGTFLRIPSADEGPVVLHVIRGGESPSFIDLPVVSAATP